MLHLIVSLLVINGGTASSYANIRESCRWESDVPLRIDSGWVCGKARYAEGFTRYASFRGVPYAKPPLGARRFKELEPAEPWDYFYDASEDSPACPQHDVIYRRLALHKRGMSEDCMYLNLHVPYDALPKEDDISGSIGSSEETTNELLPILVMIHGGGFQAGSGLTDLHGPEYLMPKRVIVVTFNYRLSVFGFLSLRTKDVPGNQGLRDQVTLLRWVQRNARAFGGDPDNVTLMGQSAGAASAHILALSNATGGLFRRFVIMSGTAITNFYSASPSYAKKVADDFILYAGINSTSPDDVYKRLIVMPLYKIMQAVTYVQHKYGSPFNPVVEDDYSNYNITRVLDDDPLRLIARGRAIIYPAIIGYTSNELEFFRPMFFDKDIIKHVEEKPKMLLLSRQLHELSAEEISRLADTLYQWCFKGKPTLDQYIACQTIMKFKYGAIKLAEWRTVLNSEQTFMYEFGYESQRSVIKEGLWTEYSGAAHVEDLTLIFRASSILGDYQPAPRNTTNDDLMRDSMTTFFTDFMRCSQPICNPNLARFWPETSYDSVRGLTYQNIVQPLEPGILELDDNLQSAVQFLDEIDPALRDVTTYLSDTYNKYQK